MATSSQGSTFTFNGVAYSVTSVSVKAPTPEVVNMTNGSHDKGKIYMVPTGDYTSPGSVEVEAIGFSDPKGSVGTLGPLVFQTRGGSVASTYAICSDASADAKIGDLLRIRFSFTLTDHQGP